MKYRVGVSIAVEAHSDSEARQIAQKITALLRAPFVRMAVENEGIRLSGDGEPAVDALHREARA